jgi:hypothetical protein
MAKEYRKENIVKTYYSVIILDDCDNIVEEVEKDALGNPLLDLKSACMMVLDYKRTDKDFKDEPKWDYRIGKHEEDDDTDWQTIYKVYKYRGRYKVKIDERW